MRRRSVTPASRAPSALPQLPAFSRELMSAPVLVVGARGYCASWLVKALCDLGFGDVRACDLPARAARAHSAIDSRATAFDLDMTDLSSCQKAMVGVKTVFHCAALVPFNLGRAHSAAELRRVNVEGTKNLLSGAAAAGVSQFIYMSSTGTVFAGDDIAGGDEVSTKVVDELGLNDAYSDSKAMAEAAVLAANTSSFSTLALRPNGIIGPNECHHTPKVVLSAALGATPFHMGPNALTDWSHRDNLVYACLRALDTLTESAASRTRVSGQPFFVTDGWACHTLEYFAPMLQGVGYPSPFKCALAVLPRSGPLQGPLAEHFSKPSEWAAAVQCGAVRVPIKVFTAAVEAGDAKLFGPEDCKAIQEDAAGGSSDQPAFMALAASQASRMRPDMIEMLLTAQCSFPEIVTLPDCAVTAGATLIEGSTKLLQVSTLGLVAREPFLTRADSRKVLKHNYYDSTLAARQLQTRMITYPADAAREMLAAAQAANVSGVVEEPPLYVWLLVFFGLLLTGLFAFNYNGYLTQVMTTLCDNGLKFTCGRPPRSFTRHICMAIFQSAILCHVLQGVFAFFYAYVYRRPVFDWASQSAFVGFASTKRLVASTGRNAKYVPLMCVSLFLVCLAVLLYVNPMPKNATKAANAILAAARRLF